MISDYGITSRLCTIGTMQETPVAEPIVQIRWDDGLEGTAKKIAETDVSPLRVLAGPGTGKTFALMRRVARLLQQGHTPGRILVCTFTRTAARDLRLELGALRVEGVDEVEASTLHALCFGILADAAVLPITGRIPRPLLKYEERFLLEDIKNAGEFGDVIECGKRLQAFTAAWARLQTDEPGWPLDDTDRTYHQALLHWLKYHGGMLIGEIVPQTLQYLRDNPACDHRSKFDHVLVDEYQDLNKAEQELIGLLGEQSKHTIIGDEDQSIYSFKHAHPEGIASFGERYPTVQDESLDQCRRCPTLVVEMANALISKNVQRTMRTLQKREGNPQGEVHVVQWKTMEQEAHGLAQFIHRQIQEGKCEAGKVLVLTPSRKIGYAIRDRLNTLGISAHSFFQEEVFDGSPKELEESKSQQAFTLLTLLAKPEDRVALRCWCGFGSATLECSKWNAITRVCAQSGETPYEFLQKLVSGEYSMERSQNILGRFQELQRRMAELENVRGQALADALFPPNEPWTERLRSMIPPIPEDSDAKALFALVQPALTQQETPLDVDYVRVMSLHKSKGLTADLVVVAGCVEGLTPRIEDGLTAEEAGRKLEEQRRLFYVALTRTRRTLILSSFIEIPRNLAYKMRVKVRMRGRGDQADAIASRFLSELGNSRPAAMSGIQLMV